MTLLVLKKYGEHLLRSDPKIFVKNLCSDILMSGFRFFGDRRGNKALRWAPSGAGFCSGSIFDIDSMVIYWRCNLDRLQACPVIFEYDILYLKFPLFLQTVELLLRFLWQHSVLIFKIWEVPYFDFYVITVNYYYFNGYKKYMLFKFGELSY